MSAREDYIAGRSGAKATTKKQEQSQAYQSGKQERERQQTIREEGIGGLSQEQQDQAKTIAKQTGKDPYNTLTQEEKDVLPSFQQEQKPSLVSGIIDFYNTYKDFGGVFGLAMVPFKMIAEPTVETFQNPQALAVLKRLFDEKGQAFKDEYLKDYGGLIEEAFKGDREKLKEQGEGVTTTDYFNEQLNEASRMSQEGVLGAGSQRINFPEEFYTGDQTKTTSQRTPQTSGGLVDLAGLDAQKYLSGPDYNPELAQMIFDARAELNRQGRNPFTGAKDSPADSPAFTGGGGGGGTPPGGGQPPSAPPQQPGQPFFPFPSTGIASIFDPAFMGPSFDPRMSAYARQGRGAFDQFYRNLERFPVV
tara:strand:- start:42 stop:1127 length:1086 start_codon:yes stop_codon:yes gene_type:complete